MTPFLNNSYPDSKYLRWNVDVLKNSFTQTPLTEEREITTQNVATANKNQEEKGLKEWSRLV